MRICLSIGLLFSMYLAFAQAFANGYSLQRTTEGMRKAIQWEPRNPKYYSRLAQYVEDDSEERDDPGEAIYLYKKAIELSPHNADFWTELGHTYKRAGQFENAQSAYEHAKLLFPNSPNINWSLGVLYLRSGKVELGLQAFQKTILGDPQNQRDTFDYAESVTGDGNLILAAMIPAHEDTLFQYLNYLSDKKRLDEAAQVWSRLLALRFSFQPDAVIPYLDALIDQRQIDQLEVVWAELLERNPSKIRNQVFDSNVVTNGDFESEILNGGLDWRITPADGVVVSVDTVGSFDGVRSLRIQFDGKHNFDYQNVFQYVPVKPATSYRFTGSMRAQGITTDNGPQFQICDAYDSAKLSFQIGNWVGTSGWSSEQLAFKTGPDTRLLLVRVARRPSRKFDNQIAGTVWVDHVALNAVE
jgi:tetratricopeptide (TPR) repeat protein